MTLLIFIEIPMRIDSVANKREHWGQKARRAASQRADTRLELRLAYTIKPVPPLVVTLTRVAPRTIDSDNLASGWKAARDGIADWLGIDDGDSRIEWRYAQVKGAVKQYAARIRIEEVRGG